MRYIIQLDDSGLFVKNSVIGWKLDPVFTEKEEEAERWHDQNAAVAWCEKFGAAATVWPVDIPLVSMVPVKKSVKRGVVTEEEVKPVTVADQVKVEEKK